MTRPASTDSDIPGCPTHSTYLAYSTYPTYPTYPAYHASSAFRRRTRGFIYASDVCQPVIFGT